jgi:hypothetical protein
MELLLSDFSGSWKTPQTFFFLCISENQSSCFPFFFHLESWYSNHFQYIKFPMGKNALCSLKFSCLILYGNCLEKWLSHFWRMNFFFGFPWKRKIREGDCKWKRFSTTYLHMICWFSYLGLTLCVNMCELLILVSFSLFNKWWFWYNCFRFHEFLKLENEIGNITRQEAVSMVGKSTFGFI